MSVRERMSLAGRSALVAGGAGHIGRAAAETLRQLDANVALLDLDERVEAVAAELGGTAIRCDLSDEDASRRAVREVAATLGGLDIVVHTAALVGSSRLEGWGVPFAAQTVAAWDAALRVNLTSAFVVAQEAAPTLRRSGHGSIILFSSIYGRVGPDPRLYEGTEMANPVAYGVSKGGVRQLVRYLAVELAPEVRVNAISPGGVQRGQPDAFRARYEARTPLGRMAVEEDVQGAVAFLASDLSSYMTGQEVALDGGWTTW